MPDNNADVIIDGFVKSHSRKYLVIAGGANYKGNKIETEYFNKLQSLSNDRVKFLGHINHPGDIIELHCNSYAYIHGHQYGGINPALLKALGCGNFILANDTPFNREVLDNGNYGVLFTKNGDSLSETINYYEKHPEKVDQFKKIAQNRITEKFTWELISDQYISLFNSL